MRFLGSGFLVENAYKPCTGTDIYDVYRKGVMGAPHLGHTIDSGTGETFLLLIEL